MTSLIVPIFLSVSITLLNSVHSVMSDSLWPQNCSTPGPSVHHQLLEFTQTHAHRVGDAIQPSHPLSSPSPPALNLSQHQGLFKWVSSSHHYMLNKSVELIIRMIGIIDIYHMLFFFPSETETLIYCHRNQHRYIWSF